jgi:hypothetical protein
MFMACKTKNMTSQLTGHDQYSKKNLRGEGCKIEIDESFFIRVKELDLKTCVNFMTTPGHQTSLVV